MRRFTTQLVVPQSPGLGQALSVRDYQNIAVQFTDPFTGTIGLEVSLDGMTFVPAGSVSGPGFTSIPGPAMWLRARVTALGSGHPKAIVSGDIIDG